MSPRALEAATITVYGGALFIFACALGVGILASWPWVRRKLEEREDAKQLEQWKPPRDRAA